MRRRRERVLQILKNDVHCLQQHAVRHRYRAAQVPRKLALRDSKSCSSPVGSAEFGDDLLENGLPNRDRIHHWSVRTTAGLLCTTPNITVLGGVLADRPATCIGVGDGWTVHHTLRTVRSFIGENKTIKLRQLPEGCLPCGYERGFKSCRAR